MNNLETRFPFCSIEEAEKETILSHLGGVPVTPDTMKMFYHLQALPMLPINPVRLLLRNVATEVVPDFYQENYDAGKLALMRGALLYAGVLKDAAGLEEVPYEKTDISYIDQATPYSLGWEAREQIIDEAPSFCEILDLIKPALETDSDAQLHSLATIGAGVIHMLTIKALRVQKGDNDFLTQHPELADVQEYFKDNM
ncbi:hypothetical protein BH23PAT2_BH23PAT2_05430 [soil metagenome]